MTYEYIKAQCLSRNIGAQWSVPDIKYTSLATVYNAYSRIYLTLNNTVLGRSIYVDMNALRDSFKGYLGTIEQWLNDIGQSALPEVETLPDPTIRFVKYANAIQTGYKINLSDRTVASDVNIPAELLPDAQLTRPTEATDLSLIHTHCLTTVAGLLHNTDTDGKKAFIIDAGKTLQKIGQAHVGIMSFLDVGEVKKVKILPENISRLDTDTPLFQKLVFTTDEPLDNKSVILSIGGYMVFPNKEHLWQVGENSFILVLENCNFVERYLESRSIIDLSSLNLTPLDNNPTAVSTVQLTSDDTIRRYFALSQSFLVVVDTPHLNTRRLALENNQVPGTYSCYQDPSYPLVTGYGRLPAYWKTLESGYWSLRVDDNFLRNFVSRQRELANVEVVTSNLSSTHPSDVSYGYLLEISTAG